jgi:allophanate hydrolase
MPPGPELSLDIASLRRSYASGALTPVAVMEVLVARLAAPGSEGIWIHRYSREQLLAAARAVEARRAADLPLYGIPFAVKDNIDVAGLPSTAACPSLSYTPDRSATVVDRLIAAGAIVVGKTNMDQLATGLVGVRSPYGVPRNPFDPRYITGGSSAGSAAALSRGLVSFALGTDTAGSGRVPAAFTNTVGLKPSRGLFSTAGVIPACRTLDCVSIFALTCEDAAAVADCARGFDARDPGSRPEAERLRWAGMAAPARFRFGVLAPSEREFFGDEEAAALHERAIEALAGLGGEPVVVPFEPFREAARLLYEGPWVAERLAPFEELLASDPGALLPVIREIIGAGRRYGGTDVFRAVHQLEALRQQVRGLWRQMDVLFLPTTPTIYTIQQIEAEPIALNARLGTYTNFVNLLELAGVAVPAGFRGDGLPLGVTFIGPRDSDARILALAGKFHRATGKTLGATGLPLPPAEPAAAPVSPESLRLAVVGAHLTGEPLNGQLTDLGARLVRTCRTAPLYRLHALPDATPPKPGMVRVGEGGSAIEIEIWELPRAAFGAFFANVRPPLGIGTIEADDGEKVAGFLCEAYAVAGARDISSFGGWRNFIHGGL